MDMHQAYVVHVDDEGIKLYNLRGKTHMAKITLDTIRLSNAQLMCGGELLLEQIPSTEFIPELMEWISGYSEENEIYADIAVEFICVSVDREIRDGLNLRLRTRDPYEKIQSLEEWRDKLCESISKWLTNRGILHRFRPPTELGTACALPVEQGVYLRKQRRVGNPTCSGSGAPIHFFTANLENYQMDISAIRRVLKFHPNSGISLELIPLERSAKGKRLIEAAVAAEGLQEYTKAYQDLLKERNVYVYVALLWGTASVEIQDQLRSGGLEFRAVMPEKNPLMYYETVFDPWLIHKRLAERIGNPEMGSIAYSLTGKELSDLFTVENRTAYGENDISTVSVRPDADKLHRLADMTSQVLGGKNQVIPLDSEKKYVMNDIMRSLDQLGQKLDAWNADRDLVHVADLEHLRDELKNDILVQARETILNQSNQLSAAVRQINEYTEAKIAPLVKSQTEAFEQLFKQSLQYEEHIEELLGRVNRVAAQVGLSINLTDQDLQFMGYTSEEEMIQAGLPDDLLESLRYAVALYHLAGRMELSDDADCLPFGFMMGCFYEQLMTRLFQKLYGADPERSTPSRLKNYDYRDNERIERYVRHVNFSDGSKLTAADWIAWLNVFYAMRQLRNRVHAEAGRLGRMDLDFMFRALFGNSAGGRANLIAQDYFRTDETGRKTESIFIPNQYRDPRIWQRALGAQKWSVIISDYIRRNPSPFEQSLMQFVIACSKANWE